MKARPYRRIPAGGLALAAIAAAAQDRPPTTEQLGKDPSARRQEADQQKAREQQQRGDQAGRSAVGRHRQPATLARRGRHRAGPGRPAHLAAAAAAGARGNRSASASMRSRLKCHRRWPSSPARCSSDITGGMCDSMLGRGVVEFPPTGPVAFNRDGRERPSTAPSTAAAARASSCCRRAGPPSRT